MRRFLAIVLMLLFPSALLSQERSTEMLAAGRFLVANRNLSDPNFLRTVVLLIKHQEDGSLGVVINRRSRAPISQILKELPEAKGRSDFVFLGGPVEKSGAMALLRSSVRLQDGEAVFADIYRLTRKGLQKALDEKAEAGRLHVYLGYAGWGAGQLETELKLGMWHTLRADGSTVFDSDPDSVWLRLIRHFETRYALCVPPSLFGHVGNDLGRYASE